MKPNWDAVGITFLTIGAMLGVFGIGVWCGETRASRPAEAAHLPEVRFVPAPSCERELRQYHALVQQQNEILDDDRRIGEESCERRLDELRRGGCKSSCRTVYVIKPGGEEVIRAGSHELIVCAN